MLRHPTSLVIGIGCDRMTAAEEVIALARRCLVEADLPEQSVSCVASIESKATEPAIHALAHALGVPVRFFAAADLEREAPRLRNPSEAVFAATGCHGVAEGAALAAAGAEGQLIVPKTRSPHATCAIAQKVS